MPAPDPNLDRLLRSAIEQTRLLQLRYRNKNRIVALTTTVSTTALTNR
jgi:hypothetical protein